MKNYVPIIEQFEEVPVICDSTGNVLSLPPIINSEYSKLELTTKNVFIEITGTDLQKCKHALNVILSAFSFYSKDKFSFEQVNINDYDLGEFVTPSNDLFSDYKCTLEYLSNVSGI